MRHKAKCGIDITETRLCVAEHDLVAKNTQALNMRGDPNNHTRWKHKLAWHNRGCVWDKIASGWSGKEEWSIEKKKCHTAEDKRDLLMSVKHPVLHRPKIGERSKPNKERKEPRQLGPPDDSICIRTEGTTVQMFGDSNVAEKCKRTKGKLGTCRKRSTRGGRQRWRIPSPRSTICEAYLP